LTGNTNIASSFLLKLDTDGNFIWVAQGDRFNLIKLDDQGNIYSRGSNDYLEFPGDVTKYNSEGTIQWTLTNVPGKFIDLDHNGGIFITGNFSGTYDFDPSPAVFNLSTVNMMPFVQKLKESTLSNQSFTTAKDQIHLFPNPMAGSFSIETSCENCDYKITDGSGKLLSDGILTSLKPIDCAEYPKGLYFVTIQNNYFSKTVKLLKNNL